MHRLQKILYENMGRKSAHSEKGQEINQDLTLWSRSSSRRESLLAITER
jgi:hypothetical protein